ncbi:AsnC family transcriptional regulator [Candidatus Woesearchaeota archaeon]|nr:AsnC family transcriptional regulator [Candidatus Woesearchaeota archaeon]
MFRINEESMKPVKLDVKDKKLLVLLSENSRMTINDLAKKVQLKRDTVAYRLKRLEKLGIVLRYYPQIDFERLGYHQFHVFYVLDESKKEKKKEFVDYLERYPGTLNLIEYSDRWDYEWTFLAKNIEEFDDAVNDVHSKFYEAIKERAKILHVDTFYSILLPYDFYEVKNKHVTEPKKKIAYDPDKKDMRLLNVLSKNARLSTYEIAKTVPLSPDAIRLRIKKLEDSGIIRKYTVMLNLSLLGYHWFTFAKQMRNFDKVHEAKFREIVEPHPYIIRAVKTIGPWDLLVYIIAANTKNFHKTIKELKQEFADVIGPYDTFVAYEEHMFNPFPDILLQ